MQQFRQFGRRQTHQRSHQLLALGFVVMPTLLFENCLSLNSDHGHSYKHMKSFRR